MSQTVRALEQRGLIDKPPDPKDGRVSHCHLTHAGARIAEAAHQTAFVTELPAPASTQASDAARGLLHVLQAGRGFASFGQCSTCRLFESRAGTHRCGLTGEALSDIDATLLCREHDASVGSF
ncbi:MAG: hypothetical protein AB8I08_23170 [Sandaracinaceae bacterium]